MEEFNKKYPKISKGIKYAGNALAIANKAYDMAKVVAAIVNSEKKYYDTSNTYTPDNTNWSIQCLTSMAQGDTKETRNGDSIAIKSLQVEGYLQFDIAQQPQELIRVMIFRSNDNDEGSLPAIGEVLESAGILAFRNKDFPKRYKMLFDKTYAPSADRPIKVIKWFKKFKMLKDKRGNPTVSQKCSFSAGTANDFTRGHIYLAVLGSVATGSTSSNTTFNSRLRFYDN